jgi:hypothetical protein
MRRASTILCAAAILLGSQALPARAQSLRLYLASTPEQGQYLSPSLPPLSGQMTVFNGTRIVVFGDHFLDMDVPGDQYRFELHCASTVPSQFTAVIEIAGQQVASQSFPVSGSTYQAYPFTVTGLDPDTSVSSEVVLRVTMVVSGGTAGLRFGPTASFIEVPGPAPGPTATPTITPTPGACTQRVADGGFEAGSPSQAWTESSTNFGTPLCTAGSCGNGGGTAGPRNGSWWAWFGGVSGMPEDGALQQAVTLPAGSATLRFWLWIGASSGNGQDRLAVLLDGGEIFSTLEGNAAYTSGYTQVEVDLSGFADGGSHTLRIESSTTGFNGASPQATNFSVDDVSVETCPAAEPSATATPAGDTPTATATPAGPTPTATATLPAGEATATPSATALPPTPQPVNLRVDFVEMSQVGLSWDASGEPDFDRYELWRWPAVTTGARGSGWPGVVTALLCILFLRRRRLSVRALAGCAALLVLSASGRAQGDPYPPAAGATLIHQSPQIADTDFVDEGLQPQHTYLYQLLVFNGAGRWAGSNVVEARTLPPPTPTPTWTPEPTSTPTETPTPAFQWNGTTSQGKMIGFDRVGNRVPKLGIGWTSACATTEITQSTSPGAPIVNNSFTFQMNGFDPFLGTLSGQVQGTFTGANTAEGTFSLRWSNCGAAVNGTWNATRS